jgi:hypothetical protein
VYNSGYTLRAAHKEILKHWKVLFQISQYKHKKGVPYWSFNRGRRFLQQSTRHFELLNKIDAIT